MEITNLQGLIGIIAGAVSLAAYLPYIFSILRKTTKPSRSSWWIWTFVGLIILLSYYDVGARNTLWVPAIFVLCPLIVASLSIFYGQNTHLDRLDKGCLILSLLSLLLWLILNNAAIALFINIIVDFFGFLPTFKKSLISPASENKLTWILFFLGSILNLLAIDRFVVDIALYPLYMLITDIVMFFLLFRKKFQSYSLQI